MSNLKFCPGCGAELVPGDRFCGDCGFDTQSKPAGDTSASAPPPAGTGGNPAAEPAPEPPSPPASMSAPPPATECGPARSAGMGQGPTGEIGRGGGGGSNALMILIAILVVLFLGGGGVYWWLSRGEEPGPGIAVPASNQAGGPAVASNPSSNKAPVAAVDLSRAATYLSEPGFKCTFFVNYPDGTAGVVERTSGRVVPAEAVRVSEVETMVDRGETYGYGFHYVERPDGTYYILDNSPNEIFPALKNNLTVGQTWNYEDESGRITWKVMDMGVTLDLGFTLIENCLIVYEDNQTVDYQALTYYAPGLGIVAVKSPGGKDDFYKMTALTRVDAAQAAATVQQWSPNWAIIKDDRTQN